MKVSIDKTTGLIIESASSSTDKTMRDNALAAGYVDVEIREVTDTEHSDLIRVRDEVGMTYVQRRARAFASKPMEEQLDMQYWDAVNGTALWLDWVAGVKAQYPKP